VSLSTERHVDGIVISGIAFANRKKKDSVTSLKSTFSVKWKKRRKEFWLLQSNRYSDAAALAASYAGSKVSASPSEYDY
jgi:hypothetical protein